MKIILSLKQFKYPIVPIDVTDFIEDNHFEFYRNVIVNTHKQAIFVLNEIPSICKADCYFYRWESGVIHFYY